MHPVVAELGSSSSPMRLHCNLPHDVVELSPVGPKPDANVVRL